MKNYLFYLLSLVLPLSGFGQLLTEGFEDPAFPPMDWTSFEVNPGASSTRQWGRTIGTSGSPAPEGTAYAIVVWERTFDDDPATNFEDWLVTKQVNLSATENTQMTFQTRSVFNRPNKFNILVSTNSQTDPAAFTLVSSWDNTTIGATPETWNVYNTKTIDLSAYDGQMIYIAFQYVNDNGGNWAIDDIIISGSATAELNDDCDIATMLTVGTDFAEFADQGTLVDATNSGSGEPTCGASGWDEDNVDVWYSFIAPASGITIVETKEVEGSALADTTIQVYSGACTALETVGCSDDDGDGSFSKIELSSLTAGEVYYVRVWEYGGDIQDDFQVSVYGVGCGSMINYEASNITMTSAELSWDEVPNAASYDIEWGETGFVQGAGTLVEGVTSVHLLDGLTGESTYDVYFRSVCADDMTGSWTEAVTFKTLGVTPSNDDCEDAIVLSCGDIEEGSTTSATNSGGNDAGDVFYIFTPQDGAGNQNITVSLCGSSYDTVLRVFSDCTMTEEIAMNDDSDECDGAQSQVSFISDGTSTYVIMVEGYSENTGNYTINISCEDIIDYCQPESDCADGDMITNVTFAGINNDTDCSPEGYSNFTDQMAQVEAGATTEISVTVGSGWTYESTMVWIDFNNNFIFESSEYFFVGSDPGTTQTADITIPAGIADGEYRMRVRVGAVNPELNDLPTLACDEETLLFGETEDYTIRVGSLGISNMSSFDFTYYPNPVKDVLNINTKKAIDNIAISDTAGQWVINNIKINNGKVDVKSLASGIYIIHIRFEDGETITFKIIKK